MVFSIRLLSDPRTELTMLWPLGRAAPPARQAIFHPLSRRINMTRLIAAIPVVLAFSVLQASAQDDRPSESADSGTIALATPGGWIMSDDQETLIVSSPSSAELIFINTSDGTVIKKVKVDFQPGALALHGSSLCAIGKGSALVYALDPKTGKIKKTIKIPDSKPIRMACHPTKGPLFVTTDSFAVLAINSETGRVTPTSAQGNFLAVDPANGEYLYTGTQKPIHEMLVLRRGPGNSVRANVARTNQNSFLAKYAIQNKGLKPLMMNPDAVVNGRELAVSPDGKKVAIVGGGGVQGDNGKRVYAIPFYETADLDTQIGQVETGAYPKNVCFHPVLELGAAEKSDGELTLFNTRSLAPIKTIPPPTRSGTSTEAILLTFGGRGTKLVYYHAGTGSGQAARPTRNRGKGKASAPAAPAIAAAKDQGQLAMIPLELTDEDRATLAKTDKQAKK
jgi:hypothetical protein